jgi:hypothetical protein
MIVNKEEEDKITFTYCKLKKVYDFARNVNNHFIKKLNSDT